MMSVHHKASATEGGEDGVTWWARACSTDREAIVLLKPEDAEMLLQDKGSYRRPPKPRAPSLHCFIGMGVGRQHECITGTVARTRGVELTAAVAVACRLLGQFFPGEAPVDVTTDRIVIGEEPWEQGTMQELVSHISSMWVPWGDVTRTRNSALNLLLGTFARGPQVGLALPMTEKPCHRRPACSSCAGDGGVGARHAGLGRRR